MKLVQMQTGWNERVTVKFIIHIEGSAAIATATATAI